MALYEQGAKLNEHYKPIIKDMNERIVQNLALINESKEHMKEF